MIVYKGPKRYKGIDDLLPELPYRDLNYGAEGTLSRYGKDDPYKEFLFRRISEDNDEAIEKEIANRKRHNSRYIANLKTNGTYGKELPQTTISINYEPIFDCNSELPIESYSYDMLLKMF